MLEMTDELLKTLGFNPRAYQDPHDLEIMKEFFEAGYKAGIVPKSGGDPKLESSVSSKDDTMKSCINCVWLDERKEMIPAGLNCFEVKTLYLCYNSSFEYRLYESITTGACNCYNFKKKE